MFEAYATLGFLAGRTTSITLALLVTGVTYRHPGLLAKTVTTLDVLSQGRSMFGIGAAWYEREHLALGVPYPPLRDRFEMLEETLQICQQMWSDNDGPYDGKHYQLAETICQPQPIRRPPVLIGGGGDLRVADRGGCRTYCRNETVAGSDCLECVESAGGRRSAKSGAPCPGGFHGENVPDVSSQ